MSSSKGSNGNDSSKRKMISLKKKRENILMTNSNVSIPFAIESDTKKMESNKFFAPLLAWTSMRLFITESIIIKIN